MPNHELDLESIRSALQDRDGWRAGPTPLMELSAEERRLHLGAELPSGEPSWSARERSAQEAARHAGRADAPAAVDLHGAGYITPVRDQGSCGSCVAFGSIAAIEGTARFKAQQASLAIDLSEAHLFYCHAAAQNRRCSTGWWVDPSLDACRDLGVVTDAEYPYTPGDQRCAVSGTASTYRIEGFTRLNGIDAMKTWLAENGPLVACFIVYEDFYAYTSGVYRHVTGNAEGGHCVCIVGYDDATDSWLAKNSWGEDWGTDGFFRIAYGECGIDYEMWGVAVPSRDDVHGTWLRTRRITGFWADTTEGNVFAYVSDAGWKQVVNGPLRDVLVNLLGIARTSNAPVDVLVVDDQIHEVYVL